MATLQNIIDSARYDLNDVGGMEFDDVQLVNYLNRMFVVMDNILVTHNSDLLRTSASISLAAGGNTATLGTRSDVVTNLWYKGREIEKRSLDFVLYDYHNNNYAAVSGTADTDTANKLVDSSATFSTNGVAVGWRAFNTTDATTALVTSVDSETTLGFASDLFPDGDENYVVSNNTGEPNYWAYNAGNFYFDRISASALTLTAYFHQKTATKVITDDMPYQGLFDEYLREALIVMASKAKQDNIVNVDKQFYNYFEQIALRHIISRKFNPKIYYIDF